MELKNNFGKKELLEDKLLITVVAIILLILLVGFLFFGVEQEQELVPIEPETNLEQVAAIPDRIEEVLKVEKQTSEAQAKESVISSKEKPQTEKSPEASQKFGQSVPIMGTSMLLLPLNSDSGTVSNILFMDTKSNESTWMFDEQDRLLLRVEQFPERGQSNGTGTQAIFYDTVTHDTNGDGEIGVDDQAGLAMSTPDGKNYRILLDSYDKILSKTLTDEKNVFMVYESDGSAYSMLFQLNPYRLLSRRELPKVATRTNAPQCASSLNNSNQAIDCAIYHGGSLSNLSASKDNLTTERSGTYWVVTQAPDDQAESHWEFVLSEGGKLMSMKQVEN